eukprot:scaffold4635_cov267-Pinguiococcus_pyrenoidosus.AAC.13
MAMLRAALGNWSVSLGSCSHDQSDWRSAPPSPSFGLSFACVLLRGAARESGLSPVTQRASKLANMAENRREDARIVDNFELGITLGVGMSGK